MRAGRAADSPAADRPHRGRRRRWPRRARGPRSRRRCARPARRDARDHVDAAHHLLHDGPAQFRDRIHQFLTRPLELHVRLGQTGEHGLGGLPERGDQRDVRRLRLDGLDHGRIEIVGEDQLFLGGEVPEERARRHVRGLRDLLDRGVGVACSWNSRNASARMVSRVRAFFRSRRPGRASVDMYRF